LVLVITNQKEDMPALVDFRLPTKNFLCVSSDNRVHIWDIDLRKEKRVYVERNHLESTYTCCSSWYRAIQQHDLVPDLGYFAVGSSNGAVIVWDLSRGVVLSTIGIAHESAVATDIAFANDGKSLYVSSANQSIVQYDIVSGAQVNRIKCGKKGATKIALNPKVNVIAAARY